MDHFDLSVDDLTGAVAVEVVLVGGLDEGSNATLARWYLDAMGQLHLGPDPIPPWDEVMVTIEDSADLL